MQFVMKVLSRSKTGTKKYFAVIWSEAAAIDAIVGRKMNVVGQHFIIDLPYMERLIIIVLLDTKYK